MLFLQLPWLCLLRGVVDCASRLDDSKDFCSHPCGVLGNDVILTIEHVAVEQQQICVELQRVNAPIIVVAEPFFDSFQADGHLHTVAVCLVLFGIDVVNKQVDHVRLGLLELLEVQKELARKVCRDTFVGKLRNGIELPHTDALVVLVVVASEPFAAVVDEQVLPRGLRKRILERAFVNNLQLRRSYTHNVIYFDGAQQAVVFTVAHNFLSNEEVYCVHDEEDVEAERMLNCLQLEDSQEVMP